jgi:RNA polymerase sigma factor (sigma-70 family)
VGAKNNQHDLDDFANRFIRYRARGLIGRFGFTRADLEDIQQDLRRDLLEQLPRYDPSRSKRSTFTKMVVEQKLSSMIEAQRAKKRDYRLRTYSLNEEIYDDGGERVQRIETIATDDWLWAARGPRRTIEELEDLRIELRRVAARLSPDMRWLLESLYTKTRAEISHETGIPRSTLNGRMEMLRRMLEDCGLKDYL